MQYTLTLTSNSELTTPTFAVFAQLPSTTPFDAFHVAWMTKQIDQGNSTTFEWEAQWGFSWAAQGLAAGYQWRANRTMNADPSSAEQCSAVFGYDGDFNLQHAPRAPVGGQLFIQSDGSVLQPSQQPSSLGITLNGSPVTVVGTGPNLNQAFLTHPTYYIDAGNYLPGLMVDATVLTGFKQMDRPGFFGGPCLPDTINLPFFPAARSSFPHILSGECICRRSAGALCYTSQPIPGSRA
jgi:rhizosphere induced protein